MAHNKTHTVCDAVHDALKLGCWMTIQEIADNIDIDASETSISSSVRDLRKEKFGGIGITGRRSNGVFEYRLDSAA